MLHRLTLKVTKLQLPHPKRLSTVVKNILEGPSCPPPKCQMQLREFNLHHQQISRHFLIHWYEKQSFQYMGGAGVWVEGIGGDLFPFSFLFYQNHVDNPYN